MTALASKFRHYLPWLAVAYISIFWGTTFIAIKIGIAHVPVFLFIALREFSAGLILLGVGMLLAKGKLPGRKAIALQIVPGIALIAGARGLMSFSINFIPVGLASLFFSLIPMYVLIINLFTGNSIINRSIVVGALLGALGMVLVFYQDLDGLLQADSLKGIGLSVGGALVWASASIWTSNSKAGMDPVYKSGFQLLFGGLGLMLMSILTGDIMLIGQFETDSLLALVYLILLGSVGGFMAYSYAITRLPVAQVALYAFINPLVTVLLGWLILQEYLSWQLGLAFLVTLTGVYIVNRGYNRPTKTR